MRYVYILLINIVLIALVGAISFNLGKNINSTTNTKQEDVKSFKGKIYQISYPWNWIFEGPTEGPISGFLEFAKLISPSGDLQIIIGLKGDNRFEYVYDDIRQETKETQLQIGNKSYQADEQFFDINADQEFNIAILEAEIKDKRLIGYAEGAREISLPMKIQVLYRFSSENIPFEEKLKQYEQEKNAALQVLQTFKLN